MNLFLASGIAAALLGLALMQTCFTWRFYRFASPAVLSSKKDIPLKADLRKTTAFSAQTLTYDPDVAIVLCLRGADPSLLECLTGISRQNYPNYQLHLIVDDIHDPALSIVEDFYQSRNQPPIHVVSDFSGKCSLKCAALLTAIEEIPPTVEVFALLDADTVPDQNWLLDLIRPMVDPDVGATTGNRWFGPLSPSLGAYVRQFWNAAAIVQMEVYNIAWGGTLAIKRSAIMAADLPAKWSTAFCEDTMLSNVLKKQQLKLVRVPNLICENTEASNLTESWRWIVRQLITVRLYHPRWPLVKFHGWATLIGSLIAPIAIVIFWGLNDGRSFYITAAAFFFYLGCNLVLLGFIEWINLRVIDGRRGINQPARTAPNLILKLLAIALLQFLHPLACWTADGIRRVSWRGIDYEIGRHNSITMGEYVPYRELEPLSNKSVRTIPTHSIG